MRSRSILLTVAAVLFSAGTSTAQTPTSNHSDVSNTQPPETTGQAPTVSKKMGAEMEGAGDMRPAPDVE